MSRSLLAGDTRSTTWFPPSVRGGSYRPRVVEFPTVKFAYFCIVVLSISWLLHQRRTVQKVALLAASYWFAWKFEPLFLATLVGSSLVNYAVGRSIVALKRRRWLAKSVLILGLLLNLGVLGFFKYYGFFIDNVEAVARMLDIEVHLPLLELIVPFGISFYTFQGIAYIVDTYRGKAVQPESLLDFLLFIAFFPQFGAGPICRSHQLLPQLHAPSPPGVPHLSEAVALIVTGLFKKMVLGTYLASHLTTDAFLAPGNFSSLELVLAVYAYTAQVYLDFSGYTDIARGVGLLFGFDLPENFNYPYAATNIGDFWRRWHITFSTWLREYIYFPLGGSRKGRWRTYFNLMVTFTACGIWHGATWGYVIWGVLHGIGLSVYKASLDIRRDYGINTDGPKPLYWSFAGWFATISFCAFARIFFKAPDLDTAWTFWGTMFEFTAKGLGFDLGVLFVFGLTIFMNFYGRTFFNLLVRSHEALPGFIRPVAWASVMLALLTLKPQGMAATIYFQF